MTHRPTPLARAGQSFKAREPRHGTPERRRQDAFVRAAKAAVAAGEVSRLDRKVPMHVLEAIERDAAVAERERSRLRGVVQARLEAARALKAGEVSRLDRRLPAHVLEEMDARLAHRPGNADREMSSVASAKRRAKAATVRIDRSAPMHVVEQLSARQQRRLIPGGVGVNLTGTIEDVEHVVILMQENRSFDHYFGAFPGVNGFCSTASTFGQYHPPDDTTYYPWRMDTTTTYAALLQQEAIGWDTSHFQYMGTSSLTIPPGYNPLTLAFGPNGQMNNWLGPRPGDPTCLDPTYMGYFTGEDIPYHWALAERFTICDNYFSSVLANTTPNRMYFMTGTVDPTGLFGGPVLDNAGSTGGPPLTPGMLGGGTEIAQNVYHASLGWTCYPAQLSNYAATHPTRAAEVSWAIYEENTDDSGNFNVCQFFEHIDQATQRMNYFYKVENNTNEDGWGWVRQSTADPVTAPHGMLGPRKDNKSRFITDLRDGRLPRISWILPPYTSSDHPNGNTLTLDFRFTQAGDPHANDIFGNTATAYNSPNNSALYIDSILQALLASDYWNKTVFIVVYDEGDGKFDHAIPDVAPPLTLNEYVVMGNDSAKPEEDYSVIFAGAIGLGFRVPCIVISPWTVNTSPCNIMFDHTSILSFLGDVVGISEVYPAHLTSNDALYSPWRHDTVSPLTDMFDFSTSNHVPAAQMQPITPPLPYQAPPPGSLTLLAWPTDQDADNWNPFCYSPAGPHPKLGPIRYGEPDPTEVLGSEYFSNDSGWTETLGGEGVEKGNTATSPSGKRT